MNKNFLSGLSYVALIIAGLLMLISGILPHLGLNIDGAIIGVLNLIKNLFILIVIGTVAYDFTLKKKKWVKVLYWVAVFVFIAANLFNFI